MRRLPLLTAALLALASPARAYVAGEDKPDESTSVKDHPMIPRFPNSVLTDGEQKDFEEFALPVKYDSESGNFTTEMVEGRYTQLRYDNSSKASATEISRNYSAALAKAGFKTVLDVKQSASDRTLTAKLDGKQRVWVSVRIYGFNDWTQTELTVVEAKAMEQKIELDANAMLDELTRTGHVAVYGITFATGKAVISADSAKVLDEIGKLLSGNAGLKLRLEGHTDNVGKAKENLDLSKKRASAVRDWLTKNHKIDGARLTAEGFGDTKPVGPNDSDENRARNRRVELVKL